MEKALTCNICDCDRTTPQVVVSRGNPRAKIMIIGEAPGAKEDAIGEPFVGKSGKLLDKLLNLAGIDSKEDVYVCNVIKCRPPQNRRPLKEEIKLSIPWLNQQIKLVDPLVIILVGATALEALLGIRGRISNLRGKWQNLDGRLVMPLFHPAYLLRNPSKEEGQPTSLTLLDLNKVRLELKKVDLNPQISFPENFRSSSL